VKGILADINCGKQVRVLLLILQDKEHAAYWEYLGLTAPRFDELGLHPRDSDRVVWEKCQREELLLITANRNQEGPDSLESTIQSLATEQSLPVFTLANSQRVLEEGSYALRVADRLLEYLFDMDKYLGTGRLYLP